MAFEDAMVVMKYLQCGSGRSEWLILHRASIAKNTSTSADQEIFVNMDGDNILGKVSLQMKTTTSRDRNL